MPANKKPRKRSKRRVVQPRFDVVNNVLHSCSTIEVDETTVNEMMIRPYAKLRALRTNELDLNGFVDLNQINATGFCIAAIIHKEGDDATKAVLGGKVVVFEKAAEALEAIGVRFGKTGKMRALPEEFDKVRQSVLLLDQLYAVSTKGVAYRAIEQARMMVDEKLKATAKGGE